MSTAITSVAVELLRVDLEAALRAYGASTVDVVLVRLRDSDGGEGTGFTYTLGAGAGVVARMIADVVGPALCGRGASDWPGVHRAVSASTRRLGPAVFVPALSAVDIAVHDLEGVRRGLPLYRVLGGAAVSVPIYGSGRAGNALDLPELVAGTCSYRAEGYAAVKVRVGARAVEEDARRLAAVRAEVGDDYPLMVDANERLDLDGAVALGQVLGELGYGWLEEPLPAEDLAGHAHLAARLPVPLAVGEHLAGVGPVGQYLHYTNVQIYQPDAALCGGVSGLVDIAARVAAAGRRLSYHSLPELHVHLAAAASAVDFVEDFPIIAALLADRLPVVSGAVTPPERPGHGIRWDESALARFRIGRDRRSA